MILQSRKMAFKHRLLFFSLFLLSDVVSAWNTLQRFPMFSSSRLATTTTTTTTTSSLASVSRRTLFLETPTAVLVVASSAFFVSNPTPAAAAMMTTQTAKTQWNEAVQTIDDLVDHWSTIATSGDGVRTKLGTQGVGSPLFQIDKVLKVLREESEDLVEFTEQAEEFQLTLARADSMAYSANFAGGSGKPTPPAFYLEKSKKEVVELQRIAKALTALLSK